MNSMVRRMVAGFAVAGIGVGMLGATASAAEAGGSGLLPCTANQFTTKLVPGDAGVGNRSGAIQFTAKQGERCALSGVPEIGLVGAHNVLVHNEAAGGTPAVGIANGSSAYVPLHWTEIAAADEQQTPNAITYTAAAASNPHGDPIDPKVNLAWNLGAVDANADSHTIDVGAVHAGTAPTPER
ncbi:DUF4232 domain-containing protein [Sciscionella sediminilitoris]|uniref:DUF4232 domain-containing protein n=1 Tax=Sciscionella sediminilitoris TaxID=1445613 RepID=UPI0004DF42ED|nr:DUF4232 domain-containing protein [Sciscionella sp. SE31]